MNKILMLTALALLWTSAARSGTSSDAELLKRRSQEFSDASALQDGAAIARFLDDRVTFMLENGERITKQDMTADDGTPPPAVPANHLEQRDFQVQLFGNVAVTSFTDHSTVQFHGQTLATDFRSTEVWHKTRGQWLMISSQTVAVQKDPPAIALPDSVLEEYVGQYQLSGDYVLTVRRNGAALEASAGTAAPFALLPEARDVFFTPGQVRMRRLFVRDSLGHVTGLVSRKDGHDLTLRRSAAVM
jgi:ketosteroid isomerase-like protein